MASQWKTFQRLAENLVFNEAPKFIRQLQRPETLPRSIQQGIKAGIDALTGRRDRVQAGHHRGAPGHRQQRSHRAAGPQAGVRARSRRPRRSRRSGLDVGGLRGRPVTGQRSSGAGGWPRPSHPARLDAVQPGTPPDDREWVGIGSGPWDYEARPSWVRLDRVLDVPEEGIRREGAILERETFEIVAARLRRDYSWS